MTEEDYDALLELDACPKHSAEYDETDGYTGYCEAIEGASVCQECCQLVWGFIKARLAGSTKP